MIARGILKGLSIEKRRPSPYEARAACSSRRCHRPRETIYQAHPHRGPTLRQVRQDRRQVQMVLKALLHEPSEGLRSAIVRCQTGQTAPIPTAMSSTETSQPTRQQLAAQGRSAPGKVTGRLKIALDAMVWRGMKRAEAAALAGLKEQSLYVALGPDNERSHTPQ